jgi:hypothetical protein
VVSFTSRPYYHQGESPRNSLDTKFCGPRDGLEDLGTWKFLIPVGPKSRPFRRTASSGTLRRVALVRTDVSEELVTRIGELGTTLALTNSVHRLLVRASVVHSSPILVTLMKEALSSSETSVLTRSTWRNISEYAIIHNHRRKNLKSSTLQFSLRTDDKY